MATKPKNISLKKSPKFQKFLKSKFKDNLPWGLTKENRDKRKSKIQKIKAALQKAKIKNQKAILPLNKKAYNNKLASDFIDTSFSELIKSNPNHTVPKFFEVYNDLFYNIPKKGEKSHESLIKQSKEYIDNYADWRDAKIDMLIEELEKKDNELNNKQAPTEEHLFYPNGTLLRTHGSNTEIVDGVEQNLPLWVMQEGSKREFKNYDAYKVVKRAAGFTNMWYDTDKQELIGDKDHEITETLHVSDLSYIPNGVDILDDADLNLPAGEQTFETLNLGEIMDYRAVDVTCLEGWDGDPNAVQPENYPKSKDILDNCKVTFWKIFGASTHFRAIPAGETKRIYWRKDNPDFDINDTTLGLHSNLLQQQLEGDNDGLISTRGYMRLDYNHPEDTPTRYVNTPFDTTVVNPSFSADLLPNYVEPKYSNYGTRMYQRLSYGDQRVKNGDYASSLTDKLWREVLNDPGNAFYNGNHDWAISKACDDCELVDGLRKGGGYNSKNSYSRIYRLPGKLAIYWKGRYVQYLGKLDLPGSNFDRYYYVMLDKTYPSNSTGNVHGPLSPGRVFYMKTMHHNVVKLNYVKVMGGAYSFSEATKFPTDENGYYVPPEYWNKYGLE